MAPNVDSTGVLANEAVPDCLKVPQSATYRLTAGEQIPAFKVVGGWRSSSLELDQWIKSQSSIPMEQADD